MLSAWRIDNYSSYGLLLWRGRKTSDLRTAKVVEDIEKPCAWVQRLIDRPVPLLEQTSCWGIITFRDATTECSDQVWGNFLKWRDENVYLHSLWMVTVGSTINQKKQLAFWNRLINRMALNVYASMSTTTYLCETRKRQQGFSRYSSIRRRCQRTYMLTTTFILFNSEIYSMETFWGKAQRQLDQAWSVETSVGRYHHP